MLDHPVKVAFVVADVPAAIEFYTRVFDLKIEARYPSGTGEGDEFVFLKSDSIYVELLPQRAMGGAPEGFHHLAFLADEVERAQETVRARGGTITAPAFDAGVGGIRLADIAGPGGARLRLFTSGKLTRQPLPAPRSLADYVAPGTSLEKLGGGFKFTEGPVWQGAEKCFYFSDIPASITRKLARDGTISIVRQPNGKANGMTVDRDGGLLICRHGERRVVKRHRDGREEVVVERIDGKRFNSPNDIVVKSDGSVYFTDPPYGLTAEFGELGEQELPYCGVFRLGPDRGAAQCLTSEFFRPNGLCFSRDETTLYVNDSEHKLVKAFPVRADGTLGLGRLFARVEGEKPGVPDGMKTDRHGHLWVTGPGGLWIFDATGAKLGVVETPEVVGNFCFGEDDGRTLLIAASTSVYRLRLAVPCA